jgi:parallel beta-helix repeat protein
MFACDAARNRCSSTNSVVSNNTIVEPHFIGIKLDNDWSNSLISRNTIVSSAG